MNTRANIGGEESVSPPGYVSKPATDASFVVRPQDRILVTGASGFIGSRVVENLVNRGFRNILCFTRPTSNLATVQRALKSRVPGARIEVFKGNLLSPADCAAACDGVALIYHLAAGTGEKSFPEAFLNSVITTRNLLEASLRSANMRRFVLVSSFSVYTNRGKNRGRVLDESCPIEEHPELRGDAYCYAKVKQEQLLKDYGNKFGIQYVVVRPGSVYGAGKAGIIGRVGIDTFGFFLHMGGSNTIPFTHVENCADAIVLAGIVPGVDGAAFNVVDDDLPSSRQFLRAYKKNVGGFQSVYVPHAVSYALCYLWERYSQWSQGQLPPAFNRRRWHADWKRTLYSNEKLKARLGWIPKVSIAEGLGRYFTSCKQGERDA